MYLGEHTLIGKKVAVKFLHTEFTGDEDIVKRFYREARAAAAIDHKNIIDVMDVGLSPTGEPYMVMEYLEGESLSSMIEHAGPIDFPAACGILEQVLTALDAAHKKGIVHRDLKPDNIFIVKKEGEPPQIKLIDFGISKFTGAASGDTKLTKTGSLLGTPAYMSPEQARGVGDIDHRTDIYSMGVIFYEMLSKSLPFTGENYNDLLINMLTTEPRSLLEACPTLPAEAEQPVLQAMNKSPDARFQSAMEMLSALKSTESFCKRKEHLTKLATQVRGNSFAGGDLGSELRSGDKAVASSVYSDMVSGKTSQKWSGTADPADTVYPASKKGKLVVGVLVLCAVIVLATVAAVLLFSNDKAKLKPVVLPVQLAPSTSQPEPKQTDKQQAQNSVKIELKALPTDAKVYYNDSLVLKNPFWVKRGRSMANVRIEKVGFKPFKIMIQPTEDHIVNVDMAPLSPAQSGAKTKASKKQTRKTTPKKPESAKNKKELGNSGRGSKFTDDFE